MMARMTAGQFHEADPFDAAHREVIDPHAFDSQVGKVVNLRVNGEVVGHARLAAVGADSVGLVFTLETVRPGEETAQATTPMSEQEPAPEPVHEHRWREVEVDVDDYRTLPVADPRPSLRQRGLECDATDGRCPVIDDPDRGAWAGRPLNIVLEGDPRE